MRCLRDGSAQRPGSGDGPASRRSPRSWPASWSTRSALSLAGVQDVVDLVALAEPVAVSTLSALASPADLEEAEHRGLVRTDGTVARLAHPLYGEVRRAAMGTLRARRLRGQVAVTLERVARPDPPGRAHARLRPACGTSAFPAGSRGCDPDVRPTIGRAAGPRRRGDRAPVARLVHAAALSWLSRGDQAEAILQDVTETAPDAAIRAMAHLHRTGNLLFTMARSDEARLALAAAEATGALPLHVAAMSLAVSVAAGDLSPVLAQGPQLLHDDLPDDMARILVASAVAGAAALTGQRDLLDEAAVIGGLTADRVPTVIPGFGLADLQVLGHRLAGTPDRGEDQARRMLAASADLPGPARLMGLVVAGHAALAGGRVGQALLLLREAWAGLADSGHEFRFRCRTLLATALAQAGEAAQAAPLSPVSSPVSIRPTCSWRPTTSWHGRGVPPPRDRRPRRSTTPSPQPSSPERWAPPPTRCSPGRPRSSSATRRRLCPASPHSPDSVLVPRSPAPMPGPGRTRTARRFSRSPRAGPGSATSSPPAMQPPRRPTCIAARGGRVRPSSAAALAEKLAARSGARTPALALALRPLPLTATRTRDRRAGRQRAVE